ncbi:MAG TPA: hypothetical protein VGP82_16235, partial [Ktedonobacterales bacterium]|nr:hypothetical protein [Ktedonobacterales bacterium]
MTEREDIQCSDHIARASGPAIRALIDSMVSAPLPAYVARLRAKGFIEADCTYRLVVKLADELACAGGTHLLGLYSANAIGALRLALKVAQAAVVRGFHAISIVQELMCQ